MRASSFRLLLLGAVPATATDSQARVAKCTEPPTPSQRWTLDSPERGFVFNSATKLCLNVAGCHNPVIFDACAEPPKQTCSGLKGQPNEQFVLNGTRVLSALPGSSCLTVTGDGLVELATCDATEPPNQRWSFVQGGQLKLADGRCMTATAQPAPPPPPTSGCHISLVRELSTLPCTRGTSYDCSEGGTMWTAAGCAGLFNCNGVDNIDCDSRHGGHPSNTTCACGKPAPGPAPTPAPTPSPPRANRTNIPMPGIQQINAISFELEMFIHFSIDTYSTVLDPTLFAPPTDKLNVSQWVSVAKSMGARVAALTSKHEKGFCLWPSKYSNFTIAHSPTVGHRDLVREFTDECRKQGIKPGLYFTTTDTYNKDKPNKAEIQLQQMTELTTNYGDDIAYFWFDHHTASWKPIDAIVRKHQPQCAMLGPDCWLTGQERGFSNYPMWHGVDTTDNSTHGRPVAADATAGNPHGTWFKVWESDCSNYDGCHPWFFGGDNPQPLPLMMEHWESTYGMGHNYILNMPPSKDGIITPKMAAAAAAFGAERHRRYGQGSSDPHTPSKCELARAEGRLGQWTEDSAAASLRQTQTQLVLDLGKEAAVDRIFLSEDVVHDGQLVGQYTVDACSGVPLSACDSGNLWTSLVNGTSAKGGQTIGTHHIDHVNATLRFARLRLLRVLHAATLPRISFRALKVAN